MVGWTPHYWTAICHINDSDSECIASTGVSLRMTFLTLFAILSMYASWVTWDDVILRMLTPHGLNHVCDIVGIMLGGMRRMTISAGGK